MSSPNNANKSISSSSHRLPTLTASQALQQAVPPDPIRTNLLSLDTLLQPPTSFSVPGLQRGQITEIYGPPGSGKTALCMQAASVALKNHESVIWLDTAAPLPTPRFLQILNPSNPTISPSPSSSPPPPSSSSTATVTPLRSNDALLSDFHYIHLPSLAHLLALLLPVPPSTSSTSISTPSSFPPPNTVLLILDSLSTLLPPNPSTSTSSTNRNSKFRSRFSLLATLAQSLRKFALLHNLAILVLNPCGTSIRDLGNGRGKRAVLRSAVVGKGWEESVATCVCLFRDFVANGDGERKAGRFAEIVRGGGAGTRVAFEIRKDGVREVPSNDAVSLRARPLSSSFTSATAAASAPTAAHSRNAPPKRKAAEIADSEDEDEDDLPLPTGIGVSLKRASSDDYGDLLDGDWEALVAAEKGLGEEGEEGSGEEPVEEGEGNEEVGNGSAEGASHEAELS